MTDILSQVCSAQLETDTKLVGLVDQMRNAFHFSEEVRSLNDRTGSLKPKLSSLPEVTAECSRFVQEYATRSFAGTWHVFLHSRRIIVPPGRLAHWNGDQRIDEYIGRFEDLRKGLDSDIMININKGVDDIGEHNISCWFQ